MEAADTSSKTSLTRALYAPVVLLAPAIAAYCFVAAWAGYLTNPPVPWFVVRPPWYVSIVTLAGFIVPGARAWWRVCRRQPLVADARLQARPVVAAVVALFSASTLGMAMLIIWALADAWAKAADDFGGPLGFFCMIMATAAAVALLVAETALMDRYASPRHAGQIS